ncbi:MAG TPA: hypothetical protein DER17_03600 [Oscillibacter sp.]|jgi:ABC-type oligopeptide transport system substrate-binding subunit|nr:hypothetical protein [Oscillibacter sp.]
MKKLAVLFLSLTMALLLVACTSSSHRSSSSGSSSSYDYDKGYGYTAPKSGQSFSDYVKEQDPDLYNSMVDRYNSLS